MLPNMCLSFKSVTFSQCFVSCDLLSIYVFDLLLADGFNIVFVGNDSDTAYRDRIVFYLCNIESRRLLSSCCHISLSVF